MNKLILKLIMVLSVAFLSSCSPTILNFSCSDPSVMIYIDDEYVGNSYVSYRFPSGIETMVVKGVRDGQEIYSRTFYKESWQNNETIDIQPMEDFRYSSPNQ